ncbi:AsnC family transcriptional regulator [bacterium]|nr:AsnC family transcriptional regulator [bacterium]|tara:strand:+ start:2193 stop:3254 length:1062 start_codon:yes stop_codon:yes gene_type:complete
MNKFNEKIQKAIQQSPQILIKISQIDEFKGRWKGELNLSPKILKRLRHAILVASTGASTRIEGSKMSDQEIENLLQGLKTTKLENRDSQEVAGYSKLLKLIFEGFKKIKFSESAILHFHKILLQYSEKDKNHLGNYKKTSNAVIAKDLQGKEVILFNPTAPYLTSKEMQELVDWTLSAFQEKQIHPLLIIGYFVYEFLSIHPFQDGNGRLSRVLNVFFLLKQGYNYALYASLEKIIEDNKSEYYLSLRLSQKNRKTKAENILSWLNFFLDVLIKQTQVAQELLDQKKKEDLLSPKQSMVLELIRKYKSSKIQDLESKTKILRPTLKQVLGRLVDLGLIQMKGQGRASYYIRKA